MFIIQPVKKEDAKGELKLLYRMIEKSLGFVPAHFELLATLDLESMKDFLNYNLYIMSHTKIDKNLLPYMRLYIANKECRSYCSNFNTELLMKMKVDIKLIYNIVEEIQNIPFEDKQKILLLKVLKALYETKDFKEEDLKELYELGFDNKDFFDLLSYATSFMSKSKMIEVYLK